MLTVISTFGILLIELYAIICRESTTHTFLITFYSTLYEDLEEQASFKFVYLVAIKPFYDELVGNDIKHVYHQ